MASRLFSLSGQTAVIQDLHHIPGPDLEIVTKPRLNLRLRLHKTDLLPSDWKNDAGWSLSKMDLEESGLERSPEKSDALLGFNGSVKDESFCNQDSEGHHLHRHQHSGVTITFSSA